MEKINSFASTMLFLRKERILAAANSEQWNQHGYDTVITTIPSENTNFNLFAGYRWNLIFLFHYSSLPTQENFIAI